MTFCLRTDFSASFYLMAALDSAIDGAGESIAHSAKRLRVFAVAKDNIAADSAATTWVDALSAIRVSIRIDMVTHP